MRRPRRGWWRRAMRPGLWSRRWRGAGSWRRAARVASPAASGAATLGFVPIVADPPAAEVASSGAMLEVVFAGAVVRVSPGVDAGLLSVVLRAVRASGS